MTDFLSCCKWIRVKAVITDKYVEKAKKCQVMKKYMKC